MRYLIPPLNWLKGLVIGAVFMSTPVLLAAAPLADEIIVVKSSDNVYFNKSVTTLIGHADESLSFKVLMPGQLNSDFTDPDDRRLFITFGAEATSAVKQLDADAHLISAYLTFEQYRELAIDDQLAILLDQPLQRYLAFCKLLLGLDSVGIILESDPGSDPLLAPSAGDYDLTLNQYRLDTANKLLPVLRQLLHENDALLMLPRQSIYNPDTLKAVLLTSYRNHKPAVSYSPAHVRAGALASIYSSPVDIGRHLAQIVNQRLEHPSAATVGFEYARFYTIATNPSVALALAINLLDERELRSSLDRVRP
ncbi:MAG: hypothetical protein GY815_01865 [Gammaproteobacteria bacterium]|nr:hypothetical protein [Gammaproteobacteria bacterium]